LERDIVAIAKYNQAFYIGEGIRIGTGTGTGTGFDDQLTSFDTYNRDTK
jgi:hypothetical protein